MTPLLHALFFLGLAAATICFCVGFCFVAPQIGRLFAWFNTGWQTLSDRYTGFFVGTAFVIAVFGFCLLCVSTTWFHITDKRLFEVALGCLSIAASLFTRTA